MQSEHRWELKKRFTFEAAHKLPSHDGKCARLHGHSWVMYVCFSGDSLQQEGPKAGMLQDYAEIKSIVKPFVDEFLDHHYLNDTTGLVNPTSEEIARWVYHSLRPKIPLLTAITIQETCTSECTYTSLARE